MKIEKLSDNQIRCTLDRKDLSDRQLKLSELAYGSDKANALFRDMIQQASSECNFEADDIPLMIEAIPVSPDCLVLLITKVTDPDELDTRFSNFTATQNTSSDPSYEPEEKTYADEILNCFEHLTSILGEQLSSKLLGTPAPDQADGQPQAPSTDAAAGDNATLIRNLTKVYSFGSLDEVIRLSKTIYRYYHGENTLYKDPKTSKYYLLVNLSDHTAEEFNKVCNIISEFGHAEKVSAAGFVYFEEHHKLIARGNAVKVLSKM